MKSLLKQSLLATALGAAMMISGTAMAETRLRKRLLTLKLKHQCNYYL